MRRRDPLSDLEPLIKRVYGYVAYCVGDGIDAEEITSATFDRARRYRESFDHRHGEPIGWLTEIARREIGVHFAGVGITPGTESADVAAPLDLHGAVRSLDAEDRELLALRYGADLTEEQVGVILGLKADAVDVAVHGALRRLQARMSAQSRPSESRLTAEGSPVQV
jgi:DNA-directed RNA polymerase specialized sigma24 family protein